MDKMPQKIELKNLSTFTQNWNQINSIGFDPTGKMVAVLGDTLSLWEVQTGQWLRNLNEEQFGYVTAQAVTFSPDGEIIAGASDGWVTLWEVASGEEILTLQDTDDPAYCISFSPDATLLATCHAGRAIRLWDTNTWQLSKTIEPAQHNDVFSIAFSPDSEIIASGSYDIAGLRIFPDSIILWDVQTGEQKQTVNIGKNRVQSLIFNDTGNLLIGLLFDQTKNLTIKIWDVTNGEELRELTTSISSVTSISYYKDILAAGCEDGSIVFWDIATGTTIGSQNIHEGSVVAIAFNPKDGNLLTGSTDGSIMLWQVYR